MSPSPYRRPSKLDVTIAEHRIGDIITLGRRWWIIRSIDGQNVHLEAANSETYIGWDTTLDMLPEPTKETK